MNIDSMENDEVYEWALTARDALEAIAAGDMTRESMIDLAIKALEQ